MKLKTRLMILIILINTVGCATPIVLYKSSPHLPLNKNNSSAPLRDGKKTAENPGKIKSEKTQAWEQTQPAFLFGLLTASQKIKAQEKCSGETHLVEIKRTFSHILVLLLTAGLYTPFKVRIVCSAP